MDGVSVYCYPSCILYVCMCIIVCTIPNNKYIPRTNVAPQVQPADDAEDKADQNLEPDEPDVGVVDGAHAVPLPDAERLLDGGPRGEPAEAEREAPCQRGDGEVVSRHLLENKMRAERERHEKSRKAIDARPPPPGVWGGGCPMRWKHPTCVVFPAVVESPGGGGCG